MCDPVPRLVLLRGINVGPHNRVAMPVLREALVAAGFERVRTYLQSGNVVLDSDLAEAALVDAVRELVATRCGLEIAAVSRTAAELAEVVARNPLRDVVSDPRRHQVSFLSAPPTSAAVERVRGHAAPAERLAVVGREIYAWHPDGVARSKMWNALAGDLGVVATARNWTTVTTLLEMATADAP